jgi:hypothetical protein
MSGRLCRFMVGVVGVSSRIYVEHFRRSLYIRLMDRFVLIVLSIFKLNRSHFQFSSC